MPSSILVARFFLRYHSYRRLGQKPTKCPRGSYSSQLSYLALDMSAGTVASDDWVVRSDEIQISRRLVWCNWPSLPNETEHTPDLVAESVSWRRNILTFWRSGRLAKK